MNAVAVGTAGSLGEGKLPRTLCAERDGQHALLDPYEHEVSILKIIDVII
jgi:hypothetical protein